MMRSAAFLMAMAVVACKPDLTSEDWLVSSPRVIAVQGDPPEVKPGAPVSFTAFVADPSSTTGRDTVNFSFCNAPKPPDENAVVSSACLGTSSLLRVGTGLTATTTMPANACILFGPIAAPGGFRPRDPDVTGGYYQPLRVDLQGADPVFHLARVSCGVANASTDIAQQFATEYSANQNPRIALLAATIDHHAALLDAIPHRARVELAASWIAQDAETYAYFDPATGTLRTQREAMQVAWYVSAGELETESTGRSSGDLGLTVSNVWTAPDESGTAHLWVVLRDSRGGVDVLIRDLTVLGG